MIVVPTEAYPISWPAGRPRQRSRINAPFFRVSRGADGYKRNVERTTHEGIEVVRDELKRIAAKTIVISSNLPLRNDGNPRSDSTQVPGGDPGVVVYWTRHERRGNRPMLVPYAIACDRYKRIADNIYAIALSIAAMRGMERWGAVSIEQAFAGFAALPAGSGSEFIPTHPAVDWRVVLGGAWLDELEPDELLAIAKARHRKLIAVAHPDAGGSHERAAELNAAIEAATQELGG